MSHALHTGCDKAAARAAPAHTAAPHATLVLITTILASSLAFIDGSVVNVGLPALGRHFAAAPGDLPWLVNAYLLPLSALLLLGGAAGDRFGRRRLLVAGIGLFAAASLACALAPTFAVLLAGRAAQGLGAAMLMPNSLAILGTAFAGEARGRAIGIWASTGAVMGALGPLLGGWLIDRGDWRAIFLINVPPALAAILLGLRFVPADRPGGDGALDWPGAVLATAGLAALTWALTAGAAPGGARVGAIVAAAAAVLAFAAFVAVEARRGEAAMMPLVLFGSRSFIGLTLLTLLLYGALGGLMVLIPYVLIEAAHWRGAQAGAALLPVTLILAAASPTMGRLAGRFGSRPFLAGGALLVGVGFLLAARFGDDPRFWPVLLPAVVVMAFGLSGAVAPLTTAVLGAVDARHTGSASGFNSAIARTGGLVATALLGGVLAAHGQALLAAYRVAMMAGAAACGGAAVCGWVLVGRTRPP